MPTALIVEDEPEANRLLALLVQLRSYRTECAYTGAEAEAVLARCRPDVVFLDLMLPDTNGYELCRRLQAAPETALIPVVVVSARIAEENRTRCFQLGAIAYVPKPYTPDQIFRAIEASEAWHRGLASSPDSGSFALEREDEQTVLGLSRLRSLLVARSPLPARTVNEVVGLLQSITQSAALWGRRSGIAHVGQVDYRIEPEQLTVRIEDRSSWFARGDFTEASAGFEPGLDHVFDVVAREENETAVRLVRHFAAGSSAT